MNSKMLFSARIQLWLKPFVPLDIPGMLANGHYSQPVWAEFSSSVTRRVCTITSCLCLSLHCDVEIASSIL